MESTIREQLKDVSAEYRVSIEGEIYIKDPPIKGLDRWSMLPGEELDDEYLVSTEGEVWSISCNDLD